MKDRITGYQCCAMAHFATYHLRQVCYYYDDDDDDDDLCNE